MDEFDWKMLQEEQEAAFRVRDWKLWADLAIDSMEFDRRLSHEE